MGLALGPLMEEYGVQAYFCGHEHNLQYLHAQGEPTHYIVSRGRLPGRKLWELHRAGPALVPPGLR